MEHLESLGVGGDAPVAILEFYVLGFSCWFLSCNCNRRFSSEARLRKKGRIHDSMVLPFPPSAHRVACIPRSSGKCSLDLSNRCYVWEVQIPNLWIVLCFYVRQFGQKSQRWQQRRWKFSP